MNRSPTRTPFVLLALGLWILACPASQSDDDEFDLLDQQIETLIEQGKFREAIPVAQKEVEEAARSRGPEEGETADALEDLGFIFGKIGDYAKAEPILQEALCIRQKVLGEENPVTANSLNELGRLYQDMNAYAKSRAALLRPGNATKYQRSKTTGF
jgi:tetratricopeptide (TPR) repeat protein